MGEHRRRADERAALGVICAVEEVVAFEWLRESQVASVRTPDLRVTLGDGVRVTVEIVMATLAAAKRLHAAARKMWPKRFPELSCEWRVIVSDHHIEKRGPSRTLKELVSAMVPVFAQAEAVGGSPQAMMERAKAALDPGPYDLNRWGWQLWREDRPWVGDDRPWEEIFEEWVRTRLADRCSYWYPPDIVDLWIDDLLPRRVGVMGPPVPTGDRCGGIHVGVGAAQKAFIEGEVEDLVSAVQRAIDKKERRGQMASVRGEKWLAVVLDGPNAAAQLEDAFGPTARLPRPDLSSVRFSSFDQVWLFPFRGKRFVVVRLSSTDDAPQCHTVDRP